MPGRSQVHMMPPRTWLFQVVVREAVLLMLYQERFTRVRP